MKKVYWFIILAAVLILLFVLRSCLDENEMDSVVSVNCQTDSLARKIKNEVKAGDTVVISGDCREDTSVVIDKDITLDGINNTIFGTPANDVIIINNATVTIKNITITNGKHGVVSKGANLTTNNVIIKDNLGVGVIAVGHDVGENEYTEMINNINRSDNDNTLNSSNEVAIKLAKIQSSQSSPPPLAKWYSCMTQIINNSAGGIYEQEMLLLFGHDSRVCTINIKDNPWGVIIIGGVIDIKDATVHLNNNNKPLPNGASCSKCGIGMGVYNKSTLFGQGGPATLRSENHLRHNICRSRDSGINTVVGLQLQPLSTKIDVPCS